MRQLLKIVFICCALFFAMFHQTSADESISVTGTIPPSASDFQLSFTSTTTTDPVPPNTTVTYQITYGSHLHESAPITLQASWDSGIIQGGGTVDIVDYVDGSASQAYGNATPVIDTTNRTITWTISTVPGQTTDQTVTFSLKTNSNYTGSNTVSFAVHANLSSNSLALPTQTVTKTYLYVSPSPTSSPTSNNFTFTNISAELILSSQIKILIETSLASSLIIRYGTTPSNLTNTISALSISRQHEISLQNLNPNTSYYIQVTATNQIHQTITSDVYTFKTATTSHTPTIDRNSIIITSGKSILFDSFIDKMMNRSIPLVVIPKGQPFEFKFSFTEDQSLKAIRMIIRRRDVLGISTMNTEETLPASNEADVLEIFQGQFIGRMKAPDEIGPYELYVKTSDILGNILEQKVMNIRIPENLKVLDKQKNSPIEGADIFLNYYNTRSQKYETLAPQDFPIQNPSYTDALGEIAPPLPPGKYLAKVRAIGFEGKDIPFSIGEENGTDFPRIYLNEQSFSILNPLKYYWILAFDIEHESQIFFENLSASRAIFNLIAAIIIIFLICLTLLAFSARLGVPPHLLHRYFVEKDRFEYHVNPKKLPSSRFSSLFFIGVSGILSMFFEFLLVLSFIFELSFGFSIGWIKVLPFLAISIINLFLWILHLHKKN